MPYPPNAQIIEEVFAELRAAIALDGPGAVVILTARSNAEPVRDFLSDNNIKGIEIKTTGTANSMAKARYILDRLKNEDFNEVRVFEDNTNNITNNSKGNRANRSTSKNKQGNKTRDTIRKH